MKRFDKDIHMISGISNTEESVHYFISKDHNLFLSLIHI